MNINSCRHRAKQDGKILFPALECWNPMTKAASIAAQVDGKRVLCRISESVLQKKFNASKLPPMSIVRENRTEIEAAASRLITNKAYDEDGSITIRLKDL